MLTSTIAGMLAGFGLFFVGVWTLTECLKQMSGRRMRQAVLQYTRHPVQGLFWGTMIGAMAQSLSAVVFILVGMISAGIITMRVAIPILAGANIGSSMLVFLSTFDLELAVMFVLGISGIVMTLVDRAWLRPIMHGFFGLGLLFLGITLIQNNAAPLVQQPWIKGLFTESGSSFLLVFLFGAALCVLAQSMGAVTILVISFGQAGILTDDMTILAVYGAQFGSGIVTYLLSINLSGSIRQIAMMQIIFTNLFGTALFVMMWVIETFYGVPLVKALLGILANDLAGQMAFLYLVLCGPNVMLLFFLPWIERGLAFVSPPSQVEKDGQPAFILQVPVADVDAALAAAQQDQNRLIAYLATFFELEETLPKSHSPQSLLQAFKTLSTELEYYLDDLGHQDLSPEQFDSLNRLTYRQKVLRALGTTQAEFMHQLSVAGGSAGMARFVKLLRTSLDTTVMTAKSALVDQHHRDLDRLTDMAGDRGDMLSKMRYAYLTKHVVENRRERMRLVQMTVTAEQIFWGLDTLCKTFHANSDAGALAVKRVQSM